MRNVECLTKTRKRLILLAFFSYEAVRLWWWGGNCGVVSFGKTPFFCSSPTTGSIFNCMCSNGVGAVESKTDTKTVTPLVTQAAGLNSPAIRYHRLFGLLLSRGA